ncbi:PREDICTED: ubiquitin-conjugating enzyme E2 J2-like isoform X2 [Prunus mume]|uniref:Ubiquitin-conjugating enzyme E2 J2-like isoform X1 n=1 Tax=Prunus mume TaxID=102107 RepID=A0ABM1LWD8_PRUMU|nr:PREDICTED: ubiquitin-conjugating enzyme E2 J2-like isoform X1 [Prunus mume]XP_016651715.1 PREDICTED: ubiquitin-conjugating enzyme E2 J2-like isoform X2 [Prunus mume]
MVVVDQGGSTKIEQNQMELDRYPAMKRILEEYSEIETKPSDDRVGSTQIEQNQKELDRYPAMKRIRGIESKPSDRVGSTQIGQNQKEFVFRGPSVVGVGGRLGEEYLEIISNPSDDFACRMLERNPYEWQFGIRGASGTEFDGGIYHGRIQFPKDYPSKPPSFTLLTENGRFKTHNKIRIRRLDDWQPSWRVRDALDALIDEMPTYPDGELGSVEYNKEERRDLAIKSRAAAPKYGTSERQKLIDEIHEYLLSKSPPVPVTQLPQLSPSQASNGTGGGYVVNVSGNIFHATNSNGVGILGSMNEFSDEGHKPKKVKLSWPKLFWWRKQN